MSKDRQEGVALKIRYGFPHPPAVIFTDFYLNREGPLVYVSFWTRMPGRRGISPETITAFALPLEYLQESIEENKSYLSRIGLPKSDYRSDEPLYEAPTKMVDHMGLARRGKLAEIVLAGSSWHGAHISLKEKDSILTLTPHALLRSELEVHRHFLDHLIQLCSEKPPQG